MLKIICEAESFYNYYGLFQAVRNSTLKKYVKFSVSEIIVCSSFEMVIDIKAKAIIVCSKSGGKRNPYSFYTLLIYD